MDFDPTAGLATVTGFVPVVIGFVGVILGATIVIAVAQWLLGFFQK
jgi:hypothetical protein